MGNKSFLEDLIVKAKLRFLKEIRLSQHFKRRNLESRLYKPCEGLVDGFGTPCKFAPIESLYINSVRSLNPIDIESAFLVWLMSFRIVPDKSAITDAADYYAEYFKEEFFPYFQVPKTKWRRIADWLYKEKHLITKRQYHFLKRPIITMLQIFVEDRILRYHEY